MRIAAMSGKFWDFIERFIDSEAKDVEAYASWMLASWQCYAINRKLKAMQRVRLSQTRLLRAEMVCKENRLYNTISIILSIQVITWIRQDLDTVFIKTL